MTDWTRRGFLKATASGAALLALPALWLKAAEDLWKRETSEGTVYYGIDRAEGIDTLAAVRVHSDGTCEAISCRQFYTRGETE